MIVVSTEDFELYHEVVTELRERDISFTTVEPGDDLPAGASALVQSVEETAPDTELPVIRARPSDPRSAIEEIVSVIRGGDGRRVVGIDPGEMPGIAVLSGEMVVATYQVAPDDVADIVREETADTPDPVVRIGDGARLIGARIVEELDAVPVELVDETGTTPYLGTGASERGMSDILAAVNIARMEGEQIESRDVEPTPGELKRIQERSREHSAENRAIGTSLARRVASGELTIEEALAEHRDQR
ncbi:hypothetical protein SAMN05216226_10423 [Halovenus aranensis]|uniref:Uncharacterized protein n=1 Tax=Halovenus aranensis TaxID=890420 RepID=A0A1G8U536_9EURY|nr:hypothetical protein [Halovenus aranensis]SDJ48215.1 hypothetical protein SAMN05216226_10423 [Halovenus aranensis]